MFTGLAQILKHLRSLVIFLYTNVTPQVLWGRLKCSKLKHLIPLNVWKGLQMRLFIHTWRKLNSGPSLEPATKMSPRLRGGFIRTTRQGPRLETAEGQTCSKNNLGKKVHTGSSFGSLLREFHRNNFKFFAPGSRPNFGDDSSPERT